MGRIGYYIPKNLSEEAADELKSKFEEKDPIPDRLKSCSEDNRNDPIQDYFINNI